MNNKKRILHLASSNKFSGAENVICTIIDNDKEKYDMFYCSLDGEIRDILAERNISYLPLKRFSIREIKKAIKNNNIDVIHAHDFKASVLAALTGFHGKIISHIHCNPDFIKSWNLYSFIYSKISKKFSSIIFVSSECIRGTVFYKIIKDKTVIIHNIVDEKRVLKLSKQSVKKIESNVVFLGRMIELKQPKKVIEITNELKNIDSNFKTIMIGSGELLSDCKNMTEELSLNNNILFLDFLKNPFPYVKNSKIAVMPSKYEGLPMSAIECMILGIPVLNSGAGGLSELFRNHKEFICETKEDYISKIKQMNNKKVYLSYKNKCKEIIKEYTDVEQYIKKINNVYEGDNL